MDCYEILIAILSQGNTSILVTILHLTTITCIFVMIVHGGLVRWGNTASQKFISIVVNIVLKFPCSLNFFLETLASII